jgi:hypothetical protein
MGRKISKLIFSLASCEPESVTNWDNIYEMPEIDNKILDDYQGVDPKDISSDTYFFVDGVMIIHNKSYYLYNDQKFAEQSNK